MNDRHDVIVIGAGHNGLTCAAYLARAGLSVLVLERRDVMGGAATTEEIMPGMTVDTCAHRIAGVHEPVFRDLSLNQYGVDILRPDPSVLAPTENGDCLTLHRGLSRSIGALERHSIRDAERLPAFLELFDAAVRLIRTTYRHPAVQLPKPGLQDAALLFELANDFRKLDRKAKAEVARVLPMSVADLMEEWFETDVLRATIAAAGVAGSSLGPRDAGTVYNLLHAHATAEPSLLRPAYFIRGGIGRLSQGIAQAAEAAKAEIRINSPVRSIKVRERRAVGVVLTDGSELDARCVVSSADPSTTALELIGPTDLEQGVVRAVRSIRYRGTCSKIHLLLGELPRFECVAGRSDELCGITSIAPSVTYLERAQDAAKYGEISPHPCLEIAIPTISQSGATTPGRHVVSIVAQYTPYGLANGSWNRTAAEHVADRVVETIAEFAPNVPEAIEHRHVVTPHDMEEEYGLKEGSAYAGDMTLDQVQFMRPIPQWSRYVTSIPNVYLCGGGTHGGGGVNCLPGYNAADRILRDFKNDVHA